MKFSQKENLEILSNTPHLHFMHGSQKVMISSFSGRVFWITLIMKIAHLSPPKTKWNIFSMPLKFQLSDVSSHFREMMETLDPLDPQDQEEKR